MMAFRHVLRLQNSLRTKKLMNLNKVMSYHCLNEAESQLGPLSSEWCERAFPKLIKLTHLLKDLDLIDGRLVNVNDKSIVIDDFLKGSMHTFKSLGRYFLGCQSMRLASETPFMKHLCVNELSDGGTVAIDSLKKVCNILNISAQQRKFVRLEICPQVTQHQIWTGALVEILNELKYEMGFEEYQCMSRGVIMAQQIVVSCLKLLDNAIAYDPDSTSWMRLAPKKVAESPPSAKWEDVLEMFNDLINCLTNEDEFLFYVKKLTAMKEGLLQMKDILVEKNIGYKEARHQQFLVQKKLTKSLGHSSGCLFTLLLYYLYGSIRDIELEICCCFSEDNGGNNKYHLCVGKILTSDGEKMVQGAVKQLDRALRIFKFVWEIAEMKDILELQGHLWSIGAENRSLIYRGNEFFIHRISL